MECVWRDRDNAMCVYTLIKLFSKDKQMIAETSKQNGWNITGSEHVCQDHMQTVSLLCSCNGIASSSSSRNPSFRLQVPCTRSKHIFVQFHPSVYILVMIAFLSLLTKKESLLPHETLQLDGNHDMDRWSIGELYTYTVMNKKTLFYLAGNEQKPQVR
jgi:hypothetical protein